jgi:hypothetical protein
MYALMHYMMGEHNPGVTDVWHVFQDFKEAMGLTREPVKADPEDMQQHVTRR